MSHDQDNQQYAVETVSQPEQPTRLGPCTCGSTDGKHPLDCLVWNHPSQAQPTCDEAMIAAGFDAKVSDTPQHTTTDPTQPDANGNVREWECKCGFRVVSGGNVNPTKMAHENGHEQERRDLVQWGRKVAAACRIGGRPNAVPMADALDGFLDQVEEEA